ncbi:TAXI family TRAP transporter solute-binding subunit [Haloarcula sp. JP-L23]|uniref:TAXI family TRAP transporter solute-binding subunit n=1 Tax=Haloarcula sp. JP-L23 TaxID=2716717 RepID=UPI00140F1B6C|nr:hypothetical protein G9465_21620 [Haloarcula sp. JP-L23]
MEFIAGPSDSLAFSMGNGLASVIRDNSDLTVNIKSGTSSQAVTLVGRGEAEMGFSTTLTGIQASQSTGAFEGTDFSQAILQLPSYYFIRLGGFVKSNTDAEYFSDLEGKSFGPGPSGTSYWPVFKLALEKALNLDGLEIVNSSVGRLPDLLSSGQAFSVGGPTLSNNVIPGFTQQVISQGKVRMLSYRSDVLEAIRDDPTVPLVDVKKDHFSNVNEFTADGDTVPMASANYVAWSSDAVSEDLIYNLYKTAWENTEALSNVHSSFKLWASKEWYTQNMTPEVPVHPGAAKFLKEIGVWDDTYSVGSI